MLWGGDVEAARGAYRVEPDDKAWRVARRLDQGRQTPVKVTFNNVRTFSDLAGRMASKMDFTADDFSRAASAAAAADSITPAAKANVNGSATDCLVAIHELPEAERQSIERDIMESLRLVDEVRNTLLAVDMLNQIDDEADDELY